MVSRSSSANSARCLRRLMSFLASSRTRLVATANNHARSFCIDVCRSARTKVSCATSSAQSRSPRRRVRYLTNASLYVRKSRSTSVTRSPAVSHQGRVTIGETLFTGRCKLDCHVATSDDCPFTDSECFAQIRLQLEQLEVSFGKRLHPYYTAGVLV